jgi:pimeloyl-ACP methyl ester carboxylesterase
MEMVKRARVGWGLDPNRVYVTGHSMGGYGTWTFGSIYADVFAGGAAFAGAPTVYWVSGKKDKLAEGVVEGYLPNLYRLPLFVFQSLDDPQVPAAANVYACGELKKLHEQDPAGWEFLYEEVNGLGHGFPKKGPKPGLEWATKHVRDPRPAKIVWQPTREWKDTFYWLRWERPWRGALLTAAADRARNAVDLTVERPRSGDAVRTEKERAEAVQRISVYLDERLLDPAKEVLLTVDGKERFRGAVQPRLETLLRSCEEREDPEYAFALEARVGPPPAATAGK